MTTFIFPFIFALVLFQVKALEISYNGTEPSLLQLYNIKTGEFLSVRLISDIPLNYIEKKDLGKSHRYTGITEFSNLRSVSTHLSAETELQVRLGLVRANSVLNTGSDAWKKESKRSVQGYIIINQETISEGVYICHQNLSNLITPSFLNPLLFQATHVLVRKEYGMEVSLTISDENQSYDDQRTVTSSVQAAIDVALKGTAKMKGDLSNEKKMSSTSNSLKVHVKSNIKTGLQVPTTVQEIPEFLGTIPNALQETNNGDGVAMKFIVEDLEVVRKCHGSTYQSKIGSSDWKHISDHRAKILNDYLQTLDVQTAEISDWLTDVHDFRKCLPNFDTEGTPLLKFKVQKFTLGFREELKSIYLGLFSTPEKDESQFDVLIATLTDDADSPNNVLTLLNDKYGRVKEKLVLFRLSEAYGINCYPVGAKRHLTFTDGFEGFFRYDSSNITDDAMTVKLKKFRDFCNKTSSDTKCYIVDCMNKTKFTVCDDYVNQDTVFYNENGKIDIKDIDIYKLKEKVCLDLVKNQITTWKRYMRSHRSSKNGQDYSERKRKMIEEFTVFKTLFSNHSLGGLDLNDAM